jgi:ribosomal protein L4
VIKSRRLRAGKGKMRNRRHVQRRGPLIVYSKDQVRYQFSKIVYPYLEKNSAHYIIKLLNFSYDN